jgi:hypothetical protein
MIVIIIIIIIIIYFYSLVSALFNNTIVTTVNKSRSIYYISKVIFKSSLFDYFLEFRNLIDKPTISSLVFQKYMI